MPINLATITFFREVAINEVSNLCGDDPSLIANFISGVCQCLLIRGLAVAEDQFQGFEGAVSLLVCYQIVLCMHSSEEPQVISPISVMADTGAYAQHEDGRHSPRLN